MVTGTSRRLAIALASPNRSPSTKPVARSETASSEVSVRVVRISVRIWTHEAPTGATRTATPAAAASSFSWSVICGLILRRSANGRLESINPFSSGMMSHPSS